jgi:hypothetical protein
MTSGRGLQGALQSWLHEDRHEDATRILHTVLDGVGTTPQRRSGGTAWRFLSMNNNIVRVGLAAAAVVVIAIIAFNLLPGTVPPGGGPTPSPSVEPSAAPSEPGASAAALPLLTQSFTSTLHGYSVSYPEGWTSQAATEPWSSPTFPVNFFSPEVDVLYDPIFESDLFLIAGSTPIGDSTPEDWAAEQMASDEGCGTATEPVTVDGAAGLIGNGCTVAVVTTGGRGYWIQLYTGSAAPEGDYSTLFEDVLATIQLLPEDAVD